MDCCICGGTIEVDAFTGWAEGNNAQPIKDGRCCDFCNGLVILERIKQLGIGKI